MKPITFLISLLLNAYSSTYAQTDTIHTKGNQQLLVSHLKEKQDEYQFTYETADGKTIKSRILKILVDSVANAKIVAKKEKKIKSAKKALDDSNIIKTDSAAMVTKAPKKKRKQKMKNLQPIQSLQKNIGKKRLV